MKTNTAHITGRWEERADHSKADHSVKKNLNEKKNSYRIP
jgi:hypothetical protein